MQWNESEITVSTQFTAYEQTNHYLIIRKLRIKQTLNLLITLS